MHGGVRVSHLYAIPIGANSATAARTLTGENQVSCDVILRWSISRFIPLLLKSSMARSYSKAYKSYPPGIIESCTLRLRHPIRLTVWKQLQTKAKEEKLLPRHVRITYHVGNVLYTCTCIVTRQPFVFSRFSGSFYNDCQSKSANKKTLKGC